MKHISPPFEIVSESPNKTYKVQINSEPYLNEMFSEQQVWYSLYKDNKTVFEKEPLYRKEGEFFLDKYPSNEWVAENVFRLGRKTQSNGRYDDVMVYNSTLRKITCVQFETGVPEKFFVLDLKPGMGVNLHTQVERDPSITSLWTSAGVRFEGDNYSSIIYATFKIKSNSLGPWHFCVNVTDSEILVSCKELEGEKYRYADEVMTIEKTAKCH